MDVTFSDQRVRERDAESTRQMVVAGPSKKKRFVARRSRLVARRDVYRRHHLHALKHLSNERRSDPIVMKASLFGDCKETGLHEP